MRSVFCSIFTIISTGKVSRQSLIFGASDKERDWMSVPDIVRYCECQGEWFLMNSDQVWNAGKRLYSYVIFREGAMCINKKTLRVGEMQSRGSFWMRLCRHKDIVKNVFW